MAQAKKTKKKVWIVKVKNNPSFVGKGAGGVQFANGAARVESPRMAAWFKEHSGYDVTEIEEEIKNEDANADANANAADSGKAE